MLQTPVQWPFESQVDRFPIEAALGICVPALVLLILGIALIVAITRRKMQRDDMEATLKMEMIERGMSAEDIERVLSARMGTSPRSCGSRGRWKYVGEMQSEARQQL
jgi:xanthine/uracil permease